MQKPSIIILLFLFLLAYNVVCKKLTQSEQEHVQKFCGYKREISSKKIIFKIYRGYEAAVNQWPWAAGLIKKGKVVNCGATLISPRHLITAAHCTVADLANACATHERPPAVTDVSKIKVLIGKLKMDETEKFMKIVKIYQNPRFIEGKCYGGGDISVLELERDVDKALIESGSVGFACLPSLRNYTGHSLYTHGWGITKAGDEEKWNSLQWTRLYLMPRAQCLSRYGDSAVPSDALCTYEDSSIVCKGDSGGPLLQKRKNNKFRYEIVGVVSLGADCGKVDSELTDDLREQKGGLFTDVRQYLDWICELTGVCNDTTKKKEKNNKQKNQLVNNNKPK